ncbi:uncharacterized protein LOC103577595 [Microplitis demolitor]|uniref:uncharacterized protein LOC103577595 n=1 Tax=Microplitis demolitor TaxID=69319 RepID=UPI0004CD6D3C|nr:uncharacterized protein LOC103577595 [Microplitis demolitor]
MLSYALPAGGKTPPGELTQGFNRLTRVQQNHGEQMMRNGLATVGAPNRVADGNKTASNNSSVKTIPTTTTTTTGTTISTSSTTMITTTLPSMRIEDETMRDNGRCHQTEITNDISPKHNGNGTTTTTTRKSTLHTSRVTKDDSLHSINSEASTVGSDRKSKIANGGKHASLKRVSFGSSKGSMVETLVYETPVQEEPEMNNFLEHNGRVPIAPFPDTDEGREKVRVAFLGPQPHPATPGVLLLEPLIPTTGHFSEIMSSGTAELLTTHTEHTSPAYHAQISTDSGWDNPFRPDGDLSREADEIVELIKGGKPITPTPGQTAPPLPGCDGKAIDEHDSSTSPLLNTSTTERTNQGNGNLHGNVNSNVNKQPVSEKVGSTTSTATVEVSRVTAQGPGDASQVEHVTLKKKPKCKCCVLQ